MEELKKKQLLEDAATHIQHVSHNMLETKTSVEHSIHNLEEKLRKGGLKDPEVLVAIMIHQIETKQQLEYSHNSPYFIRCEVRFDDSLEESTLFFGRFPFTKEAIYSWVAPAAAIRFESIGRFTYMLPTGEERSGILLRKDQFMIVDKRIIFMSSEAADYSRELIYQEYFSQRKTGFVLPEIVEQMEKAQDKIIRSHYNGSFLISGAAGSGKTTLALHRVAYLVQSPETSKLFDPNTIIVFVQDSATKQYFNALLPELGIYRVKITTFDEWAMKLLDLTDVAFVRRYGNSEEEKDIYEHSKYQALQAGKIVNGTKDVFAMLHKVYTDYFDNSQKTLFKNQQKDNVLDRFDLTLLLKSLIQKEGVLIETKEKYVKQKSTSKYIKKMIKQPVQYSLIVLDEAENYLEEQIDIIKTCVSKKTNALIYVGDLVQQTLLWTIKDWHGVNEHFVEERQVVLQKLYRNTKQILQYIQSVGFIVTIPEKIKEGKTVVEKQIEKKTDEIAFVKRLLSSRRNTTLGVLAKTEEYLIEYRKAFSTYENVHILTINEAQGVEFDTVILVGVNREVFNTDGIVGDIRSERIRVDHDLLYVALTRAISELFVLGNTKIKQLIA